MGFIDVDTHVIECEDTWDCMDPAERHFRPVPVEVPAGVAGNRLAKQMYLIGETLVRRFPTDARGAGFGAEYSGEVSHLWDPAVRLKKMDALGIDAQIVISTNFIGAQLEDPAAEAAVMRGWNRWVAQRTEGYRDRLPWVLVCPTRDMSRALQELEFGKANGAIGVMLKGVDHGYYLSSSYFHPLYQRAQELDLAIVVHQGAARQHLEGLGITSTKGPLAANIDYTATVMKAFFAVLDSDLDKRFPRLRWAFVEAGACWVPFVFHYLMRARAAATPDSYVMTERGPSRLILPVDPEGEMRSRNMFVSVDADEDIPYLSSLIGDTQLMVGTDMCHNDNGSDPLAHTQVMERADISEDAKQRIVSDNARRAFAIPADFRPADKMPADERRTVDLAIL
jgi:predicted TIM-barrel fold metal-dependent hydrolase